MYNKIVFTGPSGTGKTTWAKHIEAKFGIPYISLSGSSLWAKYGIRTHTEVIVRSIQDPQWGFQYEMELLKLRHKVYKENERFVSDRSSICNAVYALLHVSFALSKAQMDDLLGLALELHAEVDLTIYLPPIEGIDQDNDPKRALNPHYQITTDAVFERAIKDFFISNWPEGPIVAINTADRDDRSSAIDELFKPKSSIILP